MPRPRQHGNRKMLAVRIPRDLHERLTQAAIDHDVSINLLMCRAIEHYLDHALAPFPIIDPAPQADEALPDELLRNQLGEPFEYSPRLLEDLTRLVDDYGLAGVLKCLSELGEVMAQ